ncbi:hypothetical protein SteCoe_8633 [Stentor coeruleus]|uniref:Steroid 5-alpha reductase C-terminal domain-containing protein n=1 Tax=Stentor coeruleus TaxID=5963 RepID=A0A1R2CJV8_9CILI|nr:hypothetical protein SteCoe_8633 [Stentor coeruleus]
MASTISSLASILFLFLISLLIAPYLSKFETVSFLTASIILYTFTKSTLLDNYSIIDEFWSTAPIFFTYHLNHWTYRGILMLILSSIWGIRLSYNFWRKGGYRGLEDYRWRYIKSKIPNKFLWVLFNLFIISGSQTLLLLAICTPVLYEDQSNLCLKDIILTIGYLGFVLLETWADQNQWDFQCRKLDVIKSGGKLKENFVTTGLFRYSRHPNYFAEHCIWWIFYAFSYSMNLSIIGVIVWSLQFQSSVYITENLSLGKYPEYAQYQKSTSRVIPWFSSKKKMT